jgi:hypothetical protein
LEDGIELRSHEACKSLSSSAPDLVIQDKRFTFSGEISSLPSSLSHDGRIDKHAVEPLLPPGLEAAHAKSCLESSSQLMKRLEPLCQTDTVKLAFEEVIDLRSQEASKSFGSSASGSLSKDKCSSFSCEIAHRFLLFYLWSVLTCMRLSPRYRPDLRTLVPN